MTLVHELFDTPSYVLIYDYLKFRKDPSFTYKKITNYISVALVLALSVYVN